MKRNYILGSLWIVIALLLTFLLIKGFRGNKNPVNGIHSFSQWIEKHVDSDNWDSDEWDSEYYDYDGDDETMETIDPSELAKNTTFEAVGIKTIFTDLGTFPVEISKSSDSKIHIDFEGKAENYCRLSHNGSEILVKEIKRKGGFYTHINGKVYITLPESFDNELKIDNVSGSVKIYGIKAEEASIEAVSGSVSITACDIKKVKVDTVSGSSKVSGNFEQLNIESVSGSIKAESGKALVGKCDFESVSGSIQLAIPANMGYSMEYETMSGSFKDEIAGVSGSKHGKYTHGNGNTEIEVSTMSGSIKIEER